VSSAPPEGPASSFAVWRRAAAPFALSTNLADVQRIMSTAHFAAIQHTKQKRKGKSSEPYINHLTEVAELVAASLSESDTNLIIAALLHDVVEDTPTTNQEVVERFGPARFALLVATVSVMSLLPPHFRTAFRIAVALATVATDTDCEYGPASSVTANPKPKNSVLVDVHIGHKEIMASWTGLS